MTLKLTRFLTDAMEKQVKIAHFVSHVKVGKPEKIIGGMKAKIADQFGELFLNDANYVIMTQVDQNAPDFDKTKKKFAELIAAVLNTDVAKNEVKTLQLEAEEAPMAAGEEADDIEDTMPSGKVVLLVKVTTK